MHKNVLIKEMSKYLPGTVVDNTYYVDHFNKQGVKSEGLYKAVGRDKRHIITDTKENAYTMGLEAAKKVLAESNTPVEDIDMLVFVSETPEYLSPSTALVLSGNLGTLNAHMVFDMNQNCTGMIAGIDVVSRYLKTSKTMKKALLVSAFHGSMIGNPTCPVSYGCLSDGASAVILEVVEEEDERGVIDSSYLANTDTSDLMVYPACGTSNLSDPTLEPTDKKMYYGYDEADFLGSETAVGIKKLLSQNGLEPTDVEHYIVSQFEPAVATDVAEMLGLANDKFTSTVTELGYAGNSSPIFTFEKLLQEGTVNAGEKLVMSSVGAGYVISTILYKF